MLLQFFVSQPPVPFASALVLYSIHLRLPPNILRRHSNHHHKKQLLIFLLLSSKTFFAKSPLVCSTILLASKACNGGSIDTLACFFSPNYPPHCIGFEDGYTPEGFNIPCGRGNLESKPFAYAIWFIGLFSVQAFPPLVIICTMLLMYRFVLKVERRMQRYGVGSLRLRAQPNNPTEVGTGNADDGVLDRIKNAWKRIIPCLDRDKPASRSNNTRSQKRAILYIAAITGPEFKL